ncbi:MAG: helix-turn-helix domain-containing protein [Verrucomicrobiae bacterium]|nr:helix-turn-helix domain-containing protein [Verrucomicrobiae bacterium]
MPPDIKSFDASRSEFQPYGFTCETWVPKRMQRPDRHDEVELNLLNSGSITYLIGGDTVTVPARHLAVFWAATPHQIIHHEDTAPYRVVTIPLAWFLEWQFDDAMTQPVMNGCLVIDSDVSNHESDCFRFEQWFNDLHEGILDRILAARLEIEARLRRMAYSVSSNSQEPKSSGGSNVILGRGGLSKVEQMAAFVARHYTEQVQIRDIAKAVKLNPDYASSLFQKAFGTTLNKYVTQSRVSHAQRLLATTNAKIIEVAEESGFASISRFNAAFKEACGCTPKEFRLSHRLNLLSPGRTA